MKVALASLVFFSTHAFATGGFSCRGTLANKVSVTIEAGVARMTGAPIIEQSLTVFIQQQNNSFATKITSAQIVGYWAHDRELRILALDSNMNETLLEMVTRWDSKNRKHVGKAKLHIPEKNFSHTVNLTCDEG